MTYCKRGHLVDGDNWYSSVPRHRSTACRACAQAKSWLRKNPDSKLSIKEVSDEKYASMSNMRTCKTCGRSIPGSRPSQARTCSRKCGRILRAKWNIDNATRKSWESRSAEMTRRSGDDRALTGVDIHQIARRDRGICYLCGEYVDMSKPSSDPMGMHVDHIIPLSRGGMNENDNCAIVHARCNLKKAANIPKSAYFKFKENILLSRGVSVMSPLF